MNITRVGGRRFHHIRRRLIEPTTARYRSHAPRYDPRKETSMHPGLILAFMMISGSVILGVAGMIHDIYTKKHGLAKGATEKQLAEITDALREIQTRLARIEELQADMTLQSYESQTLSLPDNKG